jgi:hypothetical protein
MFEMRAHPPPPPPQSTPHQPVPPRVSSPSLFHPQLMEQASPPSPSVIMLPRRFSATPMRVA